MANGVMMLVVGAALAVVGVLMLRFPTGWVRFFRQSRSRIGQSLDRRAFTLSTVRAGGVAFLVASGAFVSTGIVVLSQL